MSQETQEQLAQKKLALVTRYAPELQQGLMQADIDSAIARLSLDKAVAERHMNTLIDKLIAACQERDKLAAENAVLKSQLIASGATEKSKTE